MTRKTIVVAAAAGTLAIAAGTAWAMDTDAAPARVAATPTTSSISSSTTTPTAPTTSSAPSAAVLSANDAARLVRSRLGGGVVTEVEAEVEHGRPEWKVEITKDGVAYEIRIDATTGGVTRFETDGDDRIDRRDDDFDDRGRRHGGHGADDGPGDDHGGHGGDDGDNSGPGSGGDDDSSGHGGDD